MNDMTLTFVGSGYPERLFGHLTSGLKFGVEERMPEIYTEALAKLQVCKCNR